MIKKSIHFLSVLFIMIFSAGIISVCSANSTEPPSIIIIVPNAPDDLDVTIIYGSTITQAKKIIKPLENSYAFYNSSIHNFNTDTSVTVSIETNGLINTILIEKDIYKYNNEYTLNLNEMTLTEGSSPLRSIILVGLRVSLTLILEGAVFFLFGYRKNCHGQPLLS